jgi:phosphoglycolate phosphatase-like HAD superfamily hydrolase
VYDIDGTLIDFSGNGIIPIIKSYQYAKAIGFIPVIITARPGTYENIIHTRNQLSAYFIDDYKYMYFLPPESSSRAQDQAEYKLTARKNLHEMGYTVVMSVGDMPWDIGAYGGVGIKL